MNKNIKEIDIEKHELPNIYTNKMVKIIVPNKKYV